ncbi:importin-9-like isoform X2 [Eriocheir sinensis]|uniref:importin-9-like isoform X2 n=1 Tax=Eriocheir sinensis TaxID=95602 RepID=UPI0021C8BD78|nr:importin-9-like isoform X2 [Eriocheir sinensis]
MAGADVSGGLRDALIDNLNNILSPQAEVRRAAEEQIHVLEVTEEFGVHLVELTLDRSGPLPIRQLASVLLKQYVEAHWSTESDKFRVPVCPDHAKAKIRELLPHGLHEPISKVRSSVAYAISAIAHWDWPDQWCGLFDLLMAALKTGQEAPVHGAMRVLTEFSRDLTDQHIPQVAPVILPEMYRIFCEEEKYGIRTRGRAVEIFSTLANLICMMGEYNRSLAKTLLYPTLPAFTQALVKGLQTPDGFTSDSGLKKEILSALTVLMKNVPKQMGQYLGEVLGPVWQTLTTSAETYVNTTVNAREDADDPVDSDGEVLGFENLVFTIFEFVHALVETTKHKQLVRRGVADLVYYLLLYMQMTEDQIENWTNNPDAFVEDEDEDSFAYSVRISAQDLLLALCQELAEECGQGLVVAVGRHLERAAGQRAAGDPAWWKTHEAVMLALGSVRDLILDQVAKGHLQFDLTNFIQSVVLADLDPNFSPFLSGRALWCGSRFGQAVTEEMLDRFLQATISALNHSPSPIIRVSGVRAVWGFCDYLKGSGRPGALQAYLPSILDGLVNLATQASSEVLSLILETCCTVVSVDASFTAANVGRISTLCLAVFIKANNDPVLVALVQDVVRELCASPACSTTLQTKFIPTLASILNASTDKVPPGMQAVALDMLEVMVRSSTPPLGEPLLGVAFPAVLQRTLNTDDNSTLQNGGECLRAYVSVAPEQVIAYRDAEGRSGLQYVVQVATQLLSPATSEHTATFVGRLITALIRRAGDHLGDNLDLLLRAVLSKLQGAESLSVVQNLVLVYAQLVHSQLEGVLNFLAGVPGPSGQSALHFVLTQWCSKQHLFFGAYEGKVSAVALAKLLEYGVTSNDARLQGIIVQGDQVFSPEARVRTRSQRIARPEQWTQVPVLVKIFKLLINELANAIDSNMTKDDDEESEDECWEDDEEEGHANGDGSLASMFAPSAAFPGYDADTVDDEEDPDAASDPLYILDLQQYLTTFITTFAQHPAFSAFVPHLNPHEQEVLQGIGVQC